MINKTKIVSAMPDVRTRDDLLCPDWSDWGDCSVKCGGGTRTRTNNNCPDYSHKYGGRGSFIIGIASDQNTKIHEIAPFGF